jgi:hypothetical protein
VLPFLEDQAGIAQLAQVKGKRTVRHTERVGDRAGRHALVASLDEQPEQGEAVLLREGAKRLDCGCGFQQRPLISTIIEISRSLRLVNSKYFKMKEAVREGPDRLRDARLGSEARGANSKV